MCSSDLKARDDARGRAPVAGEIVLRARARGRAVALDPGAVARRGLIGAAALRVVVLARRVSIRGDRAEALLELGSDVGDGVRRRHMRVAGRGGRLAGGAMNCAAAGSVSAPANARSAANRIAMRAAQYPAAIPMELCTTPPRLFCTGLAAKIKRLLAKPRQLLRIPPSGQRPARVRAPLVAVVVALAPQVSRRPDNDRGPQPSLRRIFASFCPGKRILAVPAVRVARRDRFGSPTKSDCGAGCGCMIRVETDTR